MAGSWHGRYFYQCLWITKFCAKFGCSLVLRTASAHNSFIVLRCMWKEPAPLSITVNGQLQFVLSSELSSFSVKHGHMLPRQSQCSSASSNIYQEKFECKRQHCAFLMWKQAKIVAVNDQYHVSALIILTEKISKNYQNREGIKECINWNLPSLRFALTNFKILNSLDITFSINPQVQSITCFRGLLPMLL